MEIRRSERFFRWLRVEFATAKKFARWPVSFAFFSIHFPARNVPWRKFGPPGSKFRNFLDPKIDLLSVVFRISSIQNIYFIPKTSFEALAL